MVLLGMQYFIESRNTLEYFIESKNAQILASDKHSTFRDIKSNEFTR